MPDSINPLSLPTTQSPEVISKSIAQVHEGKLASASSAAYIKALVFQHHGLWWRTIIEDLESDDPHIRRSAQIEYNKLQCRILPTELSSPEDGGIVVKVLSYAAQQAVDDANQIADHSPSIIDTSFSSNDSFNEDSNDYV